jgi:hypothetical protein
MLTITRIAGFAGAGLAEAAYVPQISHLIRARCSADISRLAFEVWLLASLLTTARAAAIHAGVFIVLGGIQIVATALIMLYAARYQGTPCPIHLPGQPGDGGGHLRKRAWWPASGRPPGCCIRCPGRLQLAEVTDSRVSWPGSGRSPGGLARRLRPERCANAAVHTFSRAPNFKRRTRRGRHDYINRRCHRSV